MPRVQVGYDPRAEALQTTAAPNIQTEQARNDPNASKAFQLAAALGAPSVQQGLEGLQRRLEQREDKEGQKGTAWANSQTVEQLGKAIKDGSLLPSQSPAFRAAANNVWGQNSLNQFANDTASKMNRGELTFESPAKLEEYLVQERNKLLAGADEFAVAGFDKRWGPIRESLIDSYNKVKDQEVVTKSVQEGSEAFRTIYDTAKREGISNEELVMRAMSQYDLLRSTKVLINDKVQKEALKGFAQTLAADGNQDALSRLLNYKLPNNGPAVRSFLGDQDSIILEKNAEATSDKRIREETDNGLLPFREAARNGNLNEEDFKKFWEPRQKVLGSATIDSIRALNTAAIAAKAREVEKIEEGIVKARENDFAVQQAQNAIAAGRPVQDITVPSGRTIKAQDAGTAAMEKFIAENPNMAPEEVIRRYAQGGIKNPKLEREVTVALNNIGEVNIDAAGKPVGQLLPATAEAITTFSKVRQVSEAYARDLAGSERNYETLVHIDALIKDGVNDPGLAAALVNQKNRRNIAPATWGSIQKSVNAEVEQITNPGITTGRFWGEVFRGEFGNGEKNLTVVKDSVKRLAETYLSAGVAGDAKQAVEKAAEYYADPRVSTQVNNTIYLNKDLPDLPQGMDRVKWFGRAMEGVVGEKLKVAGVKYNSDDLVLIPQDGGNSPYMVSLRGVPTGMFVTKQELKSWIMQTSDREDQDLIDKNKPKKRGFGPDITFPNPQSNAPSIYASPEEWKRYRESQKAK